MEGAFFELHRGLDREGPGEPADVAWAARALGLRRDARICDAGCGPGADVPALLEAAPDGHVVAIDAHAPFVEELRERVGPDPRVEARAGDMAAPGGPFDLVWCAGAAYFLGVEKALRAWRPCLAEGGAVAFSEPCMFAARPSPSARAFWEGYDAMDEAGILAAVRAAGYEAVATRRLSDAAWEAYYGPMEARAAALRPGAGEELAEALRLAREEAEAWRAHRRETGYLLLAARPG